MQKRLTAHRDVQRKEPSTTNDVAHGEGPASVRSGRGLRAAPPGSGTWTLRVIKDSLRDSGDIVSVVKQVGGLVVSDFSWWTHRE